MLPASIQVCPVEIPGRGRRSSETSIDDVHLLADALAASLPLQARSSPLRRPMNAISPSQCLAPSLLLIIQTRWRGSALSPRLAGVLTQDVACRTSLMPCSEPALVLLSAMKSLAARSLPDIRRSRFSPPPSRRRTYMRPLWQSCMFPAPCRPGEEIDLEAILQSLRGWDQLPKATLMMVILGLTEDIRKALTFSETRNRLLSGHLAYC